MEGNRRKFGTGLFGLVFLFCSVFAVAQGGQTGGLTGEVRDPSGAVVAGAQVQVINDQTGIVERQVTTGPEGLFTATLLRPGTYRVQISAPGFAQYVGIVPVRIGETVRHVAALQVGAAAEVVTVEARTTLVNTETATTGNVVDSHTLTNLPIPVPNFLYLLTLSPGAVGEPPDVRAAGRGGISITVHGQRTTNNSTSLEGINVNDFNLAHFDTIPIPNPNALQEFKIATSLYDASTGSKGGANTNLVLRTGTKDIHWGAYWQHRNDVLNANEWFTKRNNFPDNERNRLLQNVVGFSGSGPVPFLGGFIFGNIQGIRTRNGVDVNGAIANPNIPAFPVGPDGRTSAALLVAAGFLRPSDTEADVDPVAINILNHQSDHFGGTFLVPRVGQAGCGAPVLADTVGGVAAAPMGTMNCTFSKVIPGEALQHSATYDRPLRGGKDKLSLRWFHDNAEDTRPYGAGGTLSQPTGGKQRNRFATIAHQMQVSPRQLNDFRVGFSRFGSIFSPTPIINLADVGATRPNIAEIPDLYLVSITGAFSLGTGTNDDRGTISNSYTFANTWSMVTGKHTLRAGGEVNRYQLNRYNRFVIRGSLGFAQATLATGACANTQPNNDNCIRPFQAFLLGAPTSLQAAAGVPDRYFRNTDMAFFFQDDWRIHPRVTLNLGMRWEGLGFGTELLHRIANYYPEFAAAGMNPFAYPKDVNLEGFTGIGSANAVDNCVIDKCRDTNNWAPRVGMAWDIFGNQKWVFRGGYGIYYQRLSNQTTLQANLAPPFNVQLIESRPTAADKLQLANPFPTLPAASLVNLGLVPQAARFAGLRWVTATSGPCIAANNPGVITPDMVNNECVAPIFINADGQTCAGAGFGGGAAINCAISQGSFTAPDRTLGAPYTQQWNATVQHQLPRNWALEVGYVGAHNVGGIGIYNAFVRQAAPGAGEITVTDINGVTYTIDTNTVNNEPLRHEVLGLSRRAGARFTGNVGRSLYHSLQSTISHRFSAGLYFQAAYTRAWTLDNVSGSMNTDEFNITRSGQGGSNLVGLLNVDPTLGKTTGDFDRPHRLVISYTYDLPIPKSGMWGSQAFQGWSINGVTYWQSGLPFSVTTSAASGWGSAGLNVAPLNTANCINPNQAYNSGPWTTLVNAYLNSACFQEPGNVPNGDGTVLDYGPLNLRNAFRGPMQTQWDFGVGKSFTIAERHVVRFRADFFNIWNQAIFRAPSSVAHTGATFGQITQTVNPARLIQFGLKYDF